MRRAGFFCYDRHAVVTDIAEVSEIVMPLLARCDRAGRMFIAGAAIAAALETWTPEERYRALDDAMQQFRLLLPSLD
jgi:hypothetical protein